MSKKRQFWKNLKKNSCNETENANGTTLNRKKDKKTLHDLNSCSETSLLCHSSNNHTQSRIHGEKQKGRKDFICNPCDSVMNNKNTLPKIKTGDCVCFHFDKAKLDSEYIDDLVCKIKELKNRVNVFENQYGYESAIKNHSLYHYQKDVEQIGDYNIQSFQKCSNNQTNIRYNCGDVLNHNKLSNYANNVLDHDKSIYTTKSHVVSSSSAPIQEKYSKIIKPQQNKSKAPIIMALHSSNKNNFVKVNPHPNSKHFQSAAQEFIKQAEELKSKIGYILECCGYNNSTSDSDLPESLVQSDYNCSLGYSSGEFMNDEISDRDLKLFFGTLNNQYSEILSSLMVIEKRIKSLSKHKISKRLPQPSSKISSHIPNNNTNKVDTNYRSRTSALGINQKHLGADVNSSHLATEKVHSSDIQSRCLTARKNASTDKNLEPIVMVYEPIHPQYNFLNRVCKYCGQELSSCTGRCSEDSMVKFKNEVSKNKKEDEKTQKYGFVVTYTPDIMLDSNDTTSNSKESTKTKKKIKKKILPCFGF